MKRRVIILGTFLILAAFASTHVFAHDAFRVVGIITKWKQPRLEIKTPNGGRLSILVFSGADILRDKKHVTRAELKAGRNVVVDALGDSVIELEAVKINIVPTLKEIAE
jgi:hypothetical protein